MPVKGFRSKNWAARVDYKNQSSFDHLATDALDSKLALLDAAES